MTSLCPINTKHTFNHDVSRARSTSPSWKHDRAQARITARPQPRIPRTPVTHSHIRHKNILPCNPRITTPPPPPTKVRPAPLARAVAARDRPRLACLRRAAVPGQPSHPRTPPEHTLHRHDALVSNTSHSPKNCLRRSSEAYALLPAAAAMAPPYFR